MRSKLLSAVAFVGGAAFAACPAIFDTETTPAAVSASPLGSGSSDVGTVAKGHGSVELDRFAPAPAFDTASRARTPQDR